MTTAYNIVANAMPVNRNEEIMVGDEVPKFSMPTARAPRIMEKLSHERKVRSLAKNTLGSMRVGRAILLPGAAWRRGWLDI